MKYTIYFSNPKALNMLDYKVHKFNWRDVEIKYSVDGIKLLHGFLIKFMYNNTRIYDRLSKNDN